MKRYFLPEKQAEPKTRQYFGDPAAFSKFAGHSAFFFGNAVRYGDRSQARGSANGHSSVRS
ncbi:hypothetical protein [Ensifer canadensis]